MGLEKIPGSILDCMMTTMCTDRELPRSLDDYDGGLGPTPFYRDTNGGGTGGVKEEEEGRGKMGGHTCSNG